MRHLIRRMKWSSIVLIVVALAPARLATAQAWVLPEGTGAVTFVGQQIGHLGRMTNDGTRSPVGKAVNYGVDVEFDYAFTDRWSVSTSLPFILSKFTDPRPPPPLLPFQPVDSC